MNTSNSSQRSDTFFFKFIKQSDGKVVIKKGKRRTAEKSEGESRNRHRDPAIVHLLVYSSVSQR